MLYKFRVKQSFTCFTSFEIKRKECRTLSYIFHSAKLVAKLSLPYLLYYFNTRLIQLNYICYIITYIRYIYVLSKYVLNILYHNDYL